MELTEHQQRVFNRITSEIDRANLFDSEADIILSGKAGTGKTFLTAQVIKWYKAKYPDQKYTVICPSHKAKRNAVKMGIENDVLIQASTIASFLGLKPVLDRDTGIETFRANDSEIPSISYDLIVIDESMMIDKATVKSIRNNTSCFRLWVGDRWQLPPINEDESSLIAIGLPMFELTEVVRYSGDLARIVDTWAQPIESERLPLLPTGDGSIQLLSKVDWIESFCTKLIDAKIDKDYDYAKLITWTNQSVSSWSNWVRDILFGDCSIPYYFGERLSCKRPLFRKTLGSKNRDKFDLIADSGTEITVIGDYYIESANLYGYDYRYYCIPCADDFGIQITLKTLTTDSELLREAQLKKAKRNKEWGIYYDLVKSWDDVGFYAISTTHKAQGSTYGNSYLDLNNLSKCRDKRAIIYTAATRSKQLFIYK